MGNEEPSGQQAVDIEAALRWADRHEARERQKLRDMGLPPEGDMPVTGAFFVRGLVAMLRTAAPTAPNTALTDAHVRAADEAWQEQAAQQCEEWALLLSEKSAHAATAFERIQLAADAVKLRDHARAFRALARSEKGEGK